MSLQSPEGTQIPVTIRHGVLWVPEGPIATSTFVSASAGSSVFDGRDGRILKTVVSVLQALRRLPDVVNKLTSLGTPSTAGSKDSGHDNADPALSSYRIGRTTVAVGDLPRALHSMALHCSSAYLRKLQPFAPFARSVPAKYWRVPTTCDVCIHANGKSPHVHRSRRGAPRRIVLDPPQPRDPGSTTTPLRPFEHVTFDTVTIRAGKRGTTYALFGADRGSMLYTFDLLTGSSLRGALRKVIKDFKLGDRPYTVTLRADNERGILRALADVTEAYPNIRCQPLPAREPHTSDAERGWKWVSAAARAAIIEAKSGPEFRVKAIAAVVTTHMHLPQLSRGGQTPLQIVTQDFPVHFGPVNDVSLPPFGCRTWAVYDDPLRANHGPGPLDDTARTSPGVCMGYKDRFGTSVLILLDNGAKRSTYVSRRRPQFDPTSFPGHPSFSPTQTRDPAPPSSQSHGAPPEVEFTLPPPDIGDSGDCGGLPHTATPPPQRHVTVSPDWPASPIPNAPSPVPDPHPESPPQESGVPAPVEYDEQSTINLDLIYPPGTAESDTETEEDTDVDVGSATVPAMTTSQAKPNPQSPRRPARWAAGSRRSPRVPDNVDIDVGAVAALTRLVTQVAAIGSVASAGTARPATNDSVEWSPSMEYYDLVRSVAACRDHTAVGSAAEKLNAYVPGYELAGIHLMAAAQVDMSWRRTLNSSDRKAAVDSLEKEIADLTLRALDPIQEKHPEYGTARRSATPARAILNRKRDGRWKTRICIRGDLQNKLDLDGPNFVYYTEASQATSVRSLLFRANRTPDFVTGTIDISVAFLQSDPFPPDAPPRYMWFRHPVTGERHYFRQRTCVYGESAAPKRWADTLARHLTDDGFIRGANDRAVYHNPTTNVSVITHVDDLLFDGPGAGVTTFLNNLRKRFDAKDPTFLTASTPIDFLGMILARDSQQIYLSMEPYVRQAIAVMDFQPGPGRAPATPFADRIEGGEPLSRDEVLRYRMGVGSLGWMTAARPDLCFAHSRLAQHLATPTTSAMSSLGRAFDYLANNSSWALGQQYHTISTTTPSNPIWTFYTDSDFGGNTEQQNKGRPQLGAVAMCGGTPVMFTSKTSKCAFAHPAMTEAHADVGVAGSEIYALGNGLADFLGLTYAVEELGLPPVGKLDI